MMLSGAEIVVRCLQEEKVEYVFGYPGGAVLFLYDELFKQDQVRHVLVRHEQAAVHAADGYARTTDKVGRLELAAGLARFADALLRQVDVAPAGEQVLQVP